MPKRLCVCVEWMTRKAGQDNGKLVATKRSETMPEPPPRTTSTLERAYTQLTQIHRETANTCTYGWNYNLSKAVYIS